MENILKRHGVSALVTFSGFFLFTFGGVLMQPDFVFTQAAIYAALLAAGAAGVRALAKIVWELGSALIANRK